ncbi:MAG: ABC transporter permease subunit [Spirochaetaceae bacterium]|nr:ABC transporter permease subunit [Spirochaetaceae bacterium]
MKTPWPPVMQPFSPAEQSGLWRRVKNARGLFLLLAIPVVYVFIFNYIPMYGVLIAFKQFQPRLGVWRSPWAGLYNFSRFFSSPNFKIVLSNTLFLSIYGLVAGFPLPIILAIFVNHSTLKKTTKTIQSITFAPYFLSAVLLVGLLTRFFGMRTGAVNIFLASLGLKEINFMGSPAIFPHFYIWSGIWQSTGYGAIIYISSLASVDPAYHEAAIIDGATIWQKIWHIDLPTIRPIIMILLILSMGGILGTSFEKIYIMQTPLNMKTSEVIATYVYKVSIGANRPDYSFGTAIGLFQNVIGIILTLTVNKIANSLTGEGMF